MRSNLPWSAHELKAQLVYVSPQHVAYFHHGPTTGDDWDDAPWRDNAGPPSDPCIEVPFDVCGEMPYDFSVEQINRREVPWLTLHGSGASYVSIWAGISLLSFIDRVTELGGKVFCEVKR